MYGPSEAEHINRAFRGGHATVHRAVDAFVGRVMRHVPPNVKDGFEGALGSREGDNVGVSHQHPRLHTPREVTVFPAPGLAHTVLNWSAEPEIAGVRPDEEDGQVSDQSWGEDTPVEKGHQQTAKPRPSSVSPSLHLLRRPVPLLSNAESLVLFSGTTPSRSTSNATLPCLRAPGLVNTGIMCFANAVLQLLVCSPLFWNLFGEVSDLKGPHGAKVLETSGRDTTSGCYIEIFRGIRVQEGATSAATPAATGQDKGGSLRGSRERVQR